MDQEVGVDGADLGEALGQGMFLKPRACQTTGEMNHTFTQKLVANGYFLLKEIGVCYEVGYKIPEKF